MLSMSSDSMFVVSADPRITPSTTRSGAPLPVTLVGVRSWIVVPEPGWPLCRVIERPAIRPWRFCTAEPVETTGIVSRETLEMTTGERTPSTGSTRPVATISWSASTCCAILSSIDAVAPAPTVTPDCRASL
jgi:hypothetical protein